MTPSACRGPHADAPKPPWGRFAKGARYGVAAAACAISPLLVSAEAQAQQSPPPAERAQVYSRYETETIDHVLSSLHATVDPNPEGKTIERIDVVRLEVFEQSDAVPLWLNVVHATTRASIIRGEMLVKEGGRYRQVLCDDTLRNLRHLIQLSVVLIVAATGSDDGLVRLVVITKDVWSLRPDWDFAVNGGGLEQLTLKPNERNVAGLQQVATGLFIMDPSTYTLGGGYQFPRLDSSRIALVANADVVLNRSTGVVEGSGGDLTAGEPLYSGLADWSWDARVAYQEYIARRFVNAAPESYTDPATGQTVPNAYRSKVSTAIYEATRSFGWDVKHDLTFGAMVYAAAYHAALPGASAQTTADFTAAYVPADNSRAGPFLQYHTYTKRYVRLVDFETLAFQEDAFLGHDVVLRASPSFHELGASFEGVGTYAAAQYSFAVSDGFARALVATTTDLEPDRIRNAAFSSSVRLASPTFARLGRVVFDGIVLNRWRNELNVKGACQGLSTYAPFAQCSTYLGGSNRLRGFPTNFFPGKDFAAYNLELRSRPVKLLTIHVAGTAFFDSGAASNALDQLQWFHSVGLGLRMVIPWLDRNIFSADFGFPLERPIDPTTGAAIPAYGFQIALGQAFDVPFVAPPTVLPTGQSAW